MKAKLVILVALLVMAFGVAHAWDCYPGAICFTDWAAPENLGPPVNSEYMDSCVSISKDGLSLYFSSTRPNGPQGWFRDLYVSERASIKDPWGKPQPITILNTDEWESCPALGIDEHWLFFTAYREDGCGRLDIYVSYRKDIDDNLGWGPAVNLGCEADGYVNNEGSEITPAFFRDETGTMVMYFSRWLPDVGQDIYESRLQWHAHKVDGKVIRELYFGPALPVAELNTSDFSEHGPTVRRDGRELFFITNRDGGLGEGDVWTASRDSTFHEWSKPVPVKVLNSDAFEGGRISLSYDGTELYFRSDRETGLGFGDLYVARRKEMHCPK